MKKLSVQVLSSSKLTEGVKRYEHVTDAMVIAFCAIRRCYSHKSMQELIETEGDKYFSNGALEAYRLFNHIIKSGHTSTLEHITFTFSVEGVSRAMLAQLTRHRVGFSYSVQSQRYVGFGTQSRSGGFDYVTPKTIMQNHEADKVFENVMAYLQQVYDELRTLGIPQEDARAVLPNATNVDLVVTANLRALQDFYEKRRSGEGAQKEIADFAEALKDAVVEQEPWLVGFFD